MVWSRQPTDKQVVERVLAGQRDDFGLLVDRYLPMVHALAYARLGNATDADDVAQDAFLKAYASLDSLRTPARLKQWLAAIARNACVSIVRARRTQEPLSEQTPDERSVRDEVEKRELHDVLRREIGRLDEDHREALLLHYFAGMKIRELAEVLEISASAANKRLQRARKALGRRLFAELGAAEEYGAVARQRTPAIIAVIASSPTAWRAAAPAAASTAVTAGTAVKLAGGIIMMKKIVAVCAAVIVLVGALWLARGASQRDGSTAPADIAVAGAEQMQKQGRAQELSAPVPTAPVTATERSPGVNPSVALSKEPGVAPVDAPLPSEESKDDAGSALVGVVVSGTGAPIPNALVFVEEFETDPAERLAAAQAWTGADGTFRLNGEVAASRLYAWHPDYAVGWAPAMQDASIRITLAKGGTVEGTVTLGGVPWPGRRISASSDAPLGEARTSAVGAYRLAGVTPGKLTVTAEGGDGDRVLLRTVIVETGETTVVDFDFASLASTVEGVISVDGEPVAGGQADLVIVTGAGDNEVSMAEVDANGLYRFKDVPPGVATLRFSVPLEDNTQAVSSVTFPVVPQTVATQNVDFSLDTVLNVSVYVQESVSGGDIAVLRGSVVVQELTMEAFLELWPLIAATAPYEEKQQVFRGLEPGVYTVIALLFTGEDLAAPDVRPEALFASRVVELKKGEGCALELHAE